MLVRIRHISHKRNGTVIQSEQVEDRHVITIGRATDQDIFLSDTGVSYQHARLTLSPDGNIGVSSLSKAGLYLNGRFVQSGTIDRSGELMIGPYRIRINSGVKIKHNDAFIQVDISYEKVAQDVVEAQRDRLSVLKLEDTWLNMRMLSWVGASIILILFFVLPMAAHISPAAGNFLNASAFMPGNSVWSSGPLSLPHRRFSGQCNACHTSAFSGISNHSCLECHSIIADHAGEALVSASSDIATECSSCHLEHKGTDFITLTDEALCLDCHSELNNLIKTDLDDINSFESDHPQFKVLMSFRLKPPMDKQLVTTFISLDDANIRQRNGIKFSHRLHLDSGGLPSADGKRVLLCEDCHQQGGNTPAMAPVSMEQHCQSCHRLRFDKDSPERQLPHTSLDEMVVLLEEFYAMQALRQGISGSKKAITWAQEKAAALKQAAKSDTACGKCHYITRHGESEQAWNVAEINTSRRWFTRMKFSHDTHQNALCTDCHDAPVSDESEDVLIPGIEQCRQCHGSLQDSEKTVSSCVMCHQYHYAAGAVETVDDASTGTQ